MNNYVSVALIATGAALMIFGIGATTSFASALASFFSPSPTDGASWMLLGGIVFLVVGFAGGWRVRSHIIN